MAALALTPREQLEQLRHLALPTLTSEISPALPSFHPLQEQLGTEIDVLASVGKRISGVATGPDGTVWLGLFDGGVAYLPPGETHAREVPGFSGRERFVSAIMVHQGRIFAASYGGVAEVSREGRKVALHLEGVAADGLTVADGQLVVGTGRGAFVWIRDGFQPMPRAETEGAPLRITALSMKGADTWFGTPRGAYLASTKASGTRWIPLVFGSPGAQTNVVTAVVAFAEGAVVGTDDGGLAWLSPRGEVQAARFELARANEINPGAGVAFGSCAVFGTQGAGLLLASSGAERQVIRLGPSTQISAVGLIGDRVLAGTSEGELFSLRIPSGLCSAPDGRMPDPS
ncbi:MAG: hypothetical protein M3Y59_10665 [Myxococcota bacterium]|nr:hypothetical protein [Myxococcota bacterium]